LPKKKFQTTPITPTTANLRPSDPERARAEIRAFRERIAELIEKDPRKAATALSDWMARPSGRASKPKKKAA